MLITRYSLEIRPYTRLDFYKISGFSETQCGNVIATWTLLSPKRAGFIKLKEDNLALARNVNHKDPEVQCHTQNRRCLNRHVLDV